MRLAVERVVRQSEFQMTSPVHWLVFSLMLQQHDAYVISYDECLEIARQCELTVNLTKHFILFIPKWG